MKKRTIERLTRGCVSVCGVWMRKREKINHKIQYKMFWKKITVLFLFELLAFLLFLYLFFLLSILFVVF